MSACRDEIAGGRPAPWRLVINFRTPELTGDPRSPSDEHLAVGQQRRGVMITSFVQAAGRLKLKGSARTRLHEPQPRAQQNRQKDYETGDTGVGFHDNFVR